MKRNVLFLYTEILGSMESVAKIISWNVRKAAKNKSEVAMWDQSMLPRMVFIQITLGRQITEYIHSVCKLTVTTFSVMESISESNTFVQVVTEFTNKND